MKNIKKNNTTGSIISNIFKFAILAVFILSCIQSVDAQNKSTYFEQNNRSIISIQVEDMAGKWFFSVYDDSSAGDYALKFAHYDSLELSPLSDSYIDRNRPVSNFGNEIYLSVSGKGRESRGRFGKPGEGFKKVTYLKFGSPEITDQLIGAKLQLYALTDGFGGGVFYLNPNEDILDWNENSITWNNRPSGRTGQGEPGTFLDYLGDVTANRLYSFDVTNVFQYNMNYYCFAIVMREDIPTNWGSKENVHPPLLKIYYVPEKKTSNISGNVFYYANNAPISNAAINLSADNLLQNTSTDTNGKYFFENEKTQVKYDLYPFKERYSDIPPHTILTYDAALTAQVAIGLRTLTDYQKLAADVDLDEKILFYDAALIARYSIGLPQNANSRIADWVFAPFKKSLTLTGEKDKEIVDFNGIVLGDVHGGWHSDNQLSKTSLSQLTISSVKMKGEDTLSVDFSILNNSQISSFDFSLKFDSNSLQYLSSEFGHDFSDFFLNQVVNKDEIKWNGYTTKPISGGERFLKVKFELSGKMNKTNITVPYFIINNFKCSKYSFDLMNYLSGLVPEEFKMYSGYPNPFNSEILFKFDIPSNGKMMVSVYNQLGQLVRVIYNNQVDSGEKKIIWNGKNKENDTISSGIYIVVTKYNEHVVSKKILYLR